MGVFYPPHLAPLRPAPDRGWRTRRAWCCTRSGADSGAYWAARRFGVSPAGSALAGFAWSASRVLRDPPAAPVGVHDGVLDALGLGARPGSSSRGRRTRRTPFLLAAVLTLQVLPGHFQLAFITQVGVALLWLWSLAESRRDGRSRGGGVAEAVLPPWRRSFPLAAMQLWPTLRLARLAASRRDFEYLSGFAATPLHLVSYVAPGLFRAVAALASPGLGPVPYLARGVPGLRGPGAAVPGTPGDRATSFAAIRRHALLAVLAAVTLVLSLGPYVPGFASWSRLPGFSFFRAPARWSWRPSWRLASWRARGSTPGGHGPGRGDRWPVRPARGAGADGWRSRPSSSP